MTTSLQPIRQPPQAVLPHLASELDSQDWTHLDVAIAYAVPSGVQLLAQTMGTVALWTELQKRWLVGIDWCRSQPAALDALSQMARSEVRIVDGTALVSIRGCVPTRSYHPKGFLMREVDSTGAVTRAGALIGSANLSRNGLTRGHELGVWLAASASTPSAQPFLDVIDDISTWFEDLWDRATPYAAIATAYRSQFERTQSAPPLSRTDDDTVPTSLATSRGLKADDLVVLRSFDNFWIDTGNMYSNLGSGRPGNQLDLKRQSRVFFGFPAEDLSPNSAIGSVTISYARHMHGDRHLRYGDNGMDKIDLPLPGDNAPIDYRESTVLLSREIGPGGDVHFKMKIAASRSERRTWVRNSERVGGVFSFGGSSTREFGVF